MQKHRFYGEVYAYYIDNFIPIYGMVVINVKKNYVGEDQFKLNLRQRHKTDIIEFLCEIKKISVNL